MSSLNWTPPRSKRKWSCQQHPKVRSDRCFYFYMLASSCPTNLPSFFSQENKGAMKVHFVEGEIPTNSATAHSNGPVKCHYCHWSPCFIDRDDNYESMLVLGSELEGMGKSNVKIRLALYSEMSRLYRCRIQLPYCIVREIRDAYPPKKHVNVVADEYYLMFRSGAPVVNDDSNK